MILGYTSDMVLGQKIKGQGHTVTKCKNILKVVDGRREFAPLSSAHHLVEISKFVKLSSKVIVVYIPHHVYTYITSFKQKWMSRTACRMDYTLQAYVDLVVCRIVTIYNRQALTWCPLVR